MALFPTRQNKEPDRDSSLAKAMQWVEFDIMAGSGVVLNPSQLKARAVIAGDLFREGRITRAECFRLEMDAALGRNSGPINYEENTEYAELRAEGAML